MPLSTWPSLEVYWPLEKTMRIIHVGHLSLPPTHPEYQTVNRYSRHPGRWVFNLVKAQREYAGIDAQLVVKLPASRTVWSTEIEGVPVHYIGVPDLFRGKTHFFLDQRILAQKIATMSPDIVHAHGTEEANALAALRTGLPSVLTLQGCFFIINRKIPARFFSRQWIVERLERKTIPRFRHVITKSRYIREEVRREFPSVQTHLIPNTYDSALEDIDITQAREHAIAFVGTIDPRKGFDLLVEALAKLRLSGRPLPILHVFGNRTKPAAWETTQLAAARECLGTKLIMHGLRPQLEVARVVSRCRALVAPSREEMFGNQVIEALLVGTSVIVTENTAMAENVARFGNGTIVPQEESDALFKAIEKHLSAPSDEAISTSSRIMIHEYLGPDRIAEQHDALYALICGSSAGCPATG
jgi:glycosyltransferase involved in cell wall biosynthesis